MTEFSVVEGKTFLITGGASGLGAGYVELFLQEGAKSVAILDISEQTGKLFTDKLNKAYPGKVIFLKCDVSNEESLTEAFNVVVDKFGTVDVVINNAGVMNDSPNIWRKASDVNYQGMVSLTLKALKHMSKEEGGKGGTIINVSSALGFTRFPFLPIYSGCKAGILHFSYSIAMDPFHDQTGVRIIIMCYGGTDTPLLHNMDKLSYNEKRGEEMNSTIDPETIQRPESAIKGLVEAFKRGSNGTIWFSAANRPVEDITPVISKAYEMIENACPWK
ncbi:15-hydroxyprostaglandin dehydrogenase [NAD(+)]-like [Ostrinia nubilalis]|uniref:15-hydroxyprostaglandin dehydrogenase [NAD(+)]-like n=1 Tax=Ostrinia nubilalis TaxID=29057 RepID=UPI003082467E